MRKDDNQTKKTLHTNTKKSPEKFSQ